MHFLNDTPIDLSSLLAGLSVLIINDNIEENLIVKLKNVRELEIRFGSPPISERLFEQMLIMWTKLTKLYIEN